MIEETILQFVRGDIDFGAFLKNIVRIKKLFNV